MDLSSCYDAPNHSDQFQPDWLKPRGDNQVIRLRIYISVYIVSIRPFRVHTVRKVLEMSFCSMFHFSL